MKNKIILLLVLLIPSLCFGSDENNNYASFEIDGTEINIPNPSGYIRITDLEFSKNLRKILTLASTEIHEVQHTHLEHFISLSDASKITSDNDKSFVVEKYAFAYATKPFEKFNFSKNEFQQGKEVMKKSFLNDNFNKKVTELYSNVYSNLYNNAKSSELFNQEKLEGAFAKIPKIVDFNETDDSLSFTQIDKERFTTNAIMLVRKKIINLTFISSSLEKSKLLCDVWMEKILNENK